MVASCDLLDRVGNVAPRAQHRLASITLQGVMARCMYLTYSSRCCYFMKLMVCSIDSGPVQVAVVIPLISAIQTWPIHFCIPSLLRLASSDMLHFLRQLGHKTQLLSCFEQPFHSLVTSFHDLIIMYKV